MRRNVTAIGTCTHSLAAQLSNVQAHGHTVDTVWLPQINNTAQKEVVQLIASVQRYDLMTYGHTVLPDHGKGALPQGPIGPLLASSHQPRIFRPDAKETSQTS